VRLAEQLGWRAEWGGAALRCVFICDATHTQLALRWGSAELPVDYAFAGSIDPTRTDCGDFTHHVVNDDDGRSSDEHMETLRQFLYDHSDRPGQREAVQ
jgi:hypothetical protein